jgi:hypothetical protein
MTQYLNQFQKTVEKGKTTLLLNSNIISGIIDATETATLVAGDPVKIYNTTGSVIKFVKATAATDDIFGFIPFEVKQNEFVAGDPINVAFNDCVMVMEASAAIARGVAVQIDPSTSKVATKTGTNTAIGYTLDKAAADTDLIRVLIKTPRLVDEDLVGLTASIAELNTLDLSAETETIDSGDAASASLRITNIDNTTGGAGAITLAAPNAAMVGSIKIITMTVDGGDVTLALTNVVGGTAATTATFDAVGETLVLLGGANSKWIVLKEYGVTLS